MYGDHEARSDLTPMDGRGEPDAYGQAALLLVESLLHTLVERGVLTPQDIVSTVQVASDVKRDLAESTGESRERMKQSLGLLAAIERSFVAYGGGNNRR